MITTRRSLLVSLGLALPAALVTTAASATTSTIRSHKHTSRAHLARSPHHGKSHHMMSSGHSRNKHV